MVLINSIFFTSFSVSEIPFTVIFFILILTSSVIALSKTSDAGEAETANNIFFEFSDYFAREEIRSDLLKFEWVPIRSQKVADQLESIDLVKHLKQMTKDDDVYLCVISGEAGSGKTKLIYEFAGSFKNNRCYFANWNLKESITEQAVQQLKQLPGSAKYIFLDNVEINPKAAVQFCLRLMPTKEKFILVARQRKELLNLFKELWTEQIQEFQLNKMENLATVLEEANEVWLDDEIKEKMISIASGNPCVLSVCHEFIDQQIQKDEKYNIRAFFENVTDQQSLFATIMSQFKNELHDPALELIARAVLVQGLPRSDSFCKETFKYYIKLRGMNYFYVRDDKIYFKPAILGEYIARRFYFSEDEITPAFDNLLEVADSDQLRNILQSVIKLVKEQPQPILKEAAGFILTIAKTKQMDSADIIRLALFCDNYFNDAKMILDTVDNFLELEIHEPTPDLYNQMALFCTKIEAHSKAAAWWEKLLEIAREHHYDGWIIASYNNLGLVYHKLGMWEKSIECYQLAYDRFEKNKIASGIFQSLNNLAKVYQRKGDWKHAIEIYEKAARELKKSGRLDEQARTFVQIAQLFKDNQEQESALKYYKRATEVFVKTGNTRGSAQTFGNMGILYRLRHENELALESFQKTLDYMLKIDDIRGIAHTYNNLALIYQEMEETEKAIDHYLKSIVELTKIGDSRSLAQAHNNLALIYQQNENWEDAYTYHQHSLNEKEQNDDQKGMAQTYKNLGIVSQAKSEWGAASEYYQKALQLKDHLSTSDVQKIFINLGIAYQELGENDLAADALKKAIEYAAEDSDLDLLAQTYGNLGVALYEKKDFRPAIRLLNQVLFYYLKQDDVENIKKVSRVFYGIQKKMADKEFNQLADQELNRIISDGIQWKDRQIMNSDEAKEILKQMKERKQQRRTESEREAEEGEKT